MKQYFLLFYNLNLRLLAFLSTNTLALSIGFLLPELDTEVSGSFLVLFLDIADTTMMLLQQVDCALQYAHVCA